MKSAVPQYYLTYEVEPAGLAGYWHFELAGDDESSRLEAADVEPGLSGQRLELLTVVRALEALDQPSRIVLVNPSATLRQAVLFGLTEWRSNGWCWECFGQMVPVKNLDLWQRLDRAMLFHHLECRRWRIDAAHPAPGSPPNGGGRPVSSAENDGTPRPQRRSLPARWSQAVRCAVHRWWGALRPAISGWSAAGASRYIIRMRWLPH